MITINGRSYATTGSNVVVKNGNVYVNGKLVESNLSGEIRIIWDGPAANIDCTNLTVNGDIHGNVDCTNLKCSNINGDVDATNVSANSIVGKVDSTTTKIN